MLVFSSPVDYLITRVFFVYVCQVEHDLDQIDYIDSCATEEEEEEVRQPKCMESDSLSSQFMAYIDQRRISNEVVLLLKLDKFICPRKAFVMVLMLLVLRGFLCLKKKKKSDLGEEHSVVLCGGSELEC